MKTIIKIGVAAAFAMVVFTAWYAYHASAIDASSFSQIYIHNTPVCVFKEGEQVVAKIGMCPGNEEGGGMDRNMEPFPFQGDPSAELPPGHPPIGGGLFNERSPAIPI